MTEQITRHSSLCQDDNRTSGVEVLYEIKSKKRVFFAWF